MKKILFVCTGNTCRSPMAEAILNHKGGKDFEARSAGIFAGQGAPANPLAKETLKKRDISLDFHRAQPLNQELLQWADVVYAMTENHKRMIIERYPQLADKVFTIKEIVVNSEENLNKWSEWNSLRAEFEIGKASYDRKINQSQLNKQEQDTIKREIEQWMREKQAQISKLERTLPSLDIPDPFGGSAEDYEKVCLEIESIIDMLLKDEKNES